MIFNGNTWNSHEIYNHAPLCINFIHGRFISSFFIFIYKLINN